MKRKGSKSAAKHIAKAWAAWKSAHYPMCPWFVLEALEEIIKALEAMNAKAQRRKGGKGWPLSNEH